MWRVLFPAAVIAAALSAGVYAEDFPKGQIVAEVKCTADAAETYTLFLPSKYSSSDKDKKWNLLMAFDPRARGRVPVELYQAAAEKYGYIIAGSNTSRNGPIGPSLKAAQAMLADLGSRFSIDERRMYVTGLSGGARFAMDLAIGTKKFAGVIASSAGFAQPSGAEESLPFVLFGTTGTEDFNYLEMHQLDRQVTSPHRVRVFVGEHAWPPADAAMEAVGWLELQAMKTERREKDEAMIDRLFAAGKAEIAAAKNPADAYQAVRSLTADFQGLRDVSSYRARAEAMKKDKDVRSATQSILIDEMTESQLSAEIQNYSDQLQNPLEHADCMAALRERLTKLSARAKAPEDSADRRTARRVLNNVFSDPSGREDPDYRKLLDEVRFN